MKRNISQGCTAKTLHNYELQCVFTNAVDSSQSDIEDYDPTTGLRV